MTGLWRDEAPLILASKSSARQALLNSAGVAIEIMGADIDERAIEAPLRTAGASPQTIAAHLARAKALTVSAQRPTRLVVGADQVLACDGKLFAKPADRAAAKAQLLKLSGRTHALHAALSVVRDKAVLFETIATASLTCRAFDAAFVESYLDAAGDAVLASVGAYQLEGLGVNLFETIDGDYATILGLPLLPLLAFLRQAGSLAA